jgi:hypothetical protein
MRTPRKTTRGPIQTSQQQSNIFKTSLRDWQARYKEQRAAQSPALTGSAPATR